MLSTAGSRVVRVRMLGTRREFQCQLTLVTATCLTADTGRHRVLTAEQEGWHCYVSTK